MKANTTQIQRGEYISKPTWENTTHGTTHNTVHITDKFATYSDMKACLHSWFTDFILKDRYKKVREAENTAELLIMLQVCGYMTDVKYPQKMLQVCKENNIASLYR